MSQQKVDYLIVGGGLVGLATAYTILNQMPGKKVVVIEKESEVAFHQSGRNSGVIHSGIYYKPGSLKAQNCRLGKSLMEQFCSEHGIPWKTLGKVIVAVDEDEERRLPTLLERGKANGVNCELISREQLLEIEPEVTGRAAIHVPETGVVDFKEVARKLAELINKKSGSVELNTKLISVRETQGGLNVITSSKEYFTGALINCAGLYSDKVLSICGGIPEAKIIPFRGEYYFLTPEAAHVCKTLIYPVPHPDFPFLGVHLTRSVHDEVDCGPNAVLAFAREGYTKGTIKIPELIETLLFPGFQKLVSKHLVYAFRELKQSFFKEAFVHAARRLVPNLHAKDFIPAPAGVRAQAVSKEGKPVDDFLISRTKNAIHVLNAPSPAATSCLSIGRSILAMVNEG